MTLKFFSLFLYFIVEYFGFVVLVSEYFSSFGVLPFS